MSSPTGDDDVDDVDEDIVWLRDPENRALVAWLRDPENRALVNLLIDVKATTSRAQTTNDDETRQRAHEEALALKARLEVANGLQKLETQRIVSSAAGQPAHRPVSTSKRLDAIFRIGGNHTEQRYAVARILFDYLGQRASGEATRLVLADMGYALPKPNPQDEAPQGVRAPTSRQGVDPLSGPVAGVRLGLANVIGYTLGNEGKRDCPPATWTGRASLHLKVITKGRGPAINLDEIARVVAAAWADIENEALDRDPEAEPNMRGDLSIRAVFRRAWRLGNADRQNRKSDKSLILQTKRLGTP